MIPSTPFSPMRSFRRRVIRTRWLGFCLAGFIGALTSLALNELRSTRAERLSEAAYARALDVSKAFREREHHALTYDIRAGGEPRLLVTPVQILFNPPSYPSDGVPAAPFFHAEPCARDGELHAFEVGKSVGLYVCVRGFWEAL